MADAQETYNEGAEGFREKDQQEVKLKPSAVEVDQKEKPEDRMKRLNLSAEPYHNYETEQIAKGNAEDAKKDEDKPYEFTANGYTVTEADDNAKDLDESLKKYVITGEDFTREVLGKRNAEVFALTHSAAHAAMPATVPSN